MNNTPTQPNIPISTDFKILSLDGGGIKGLYAAKLLAQIEEKTGSLIGEHFDMLCGTSTGGLLALGITKGIPCKEIAKFYIEYGPLIFPYESWLKRKIRELAQIVYSTKYDNVQLESALKTLLTDYQTMTHANHFMCIPAFNLTKGMPKVFKKPFNQYHVDGRIPMLKVALATSAAPTFLPAVEIEDCQYVDGGIFNNNPSMIGYTEALDHFLDKEFSIDDHIHKYTSISILSIGLPNVQIGELPSIASKRSFLRWRKKLIISAMTGSDYITGYQTKKHVEKSGGTYYRLTPMEFSPEQLKILEMDNTSIKSIKTLTAFGQAVGDDYTSSNWPQIEYFFNSLKSFKF